jgi:hypothetical protein
MAEQLQLDPIARANAALDQQVRDVLLGRAGAYELPPECRLLLRLLEHRRGAAQAITIRELQQRALGEPHRRRISEREIKAAAKQLREDFGVPVGASRGETPGYFLCLTREDFVTAMTPWAHEIRSLRRSWDVMAEMCARLGQGDLDLERAS